MTSRLGSLKEGGTPDLVIKRRKAQFVTVNDSNYAVEIVYLTKKLYVALSQVARGGYNSLTPIIKVPINQTSETFEDQVTLVAQLLSFLNSDERQVYLNFAEGDSVKTLFQSWVYEFFKSDFHSVKLPDFHFKVNFGYRVNLRFANLSANFFMFPVSFTFTKTLVSTTLVSTFYERFSFEKVDRLFLSSANVDRYILLALFKKLSLMGGLGFDRDSGYYFVETSLTPYFKPSIKIRLLLASAQLFKPSIIIKLASLPIDYLLTHSNDNVSAIVTSS